MPSTCHYCTYTHTLVHSYTHTLIHSHSPTHTHTLIHPPTHPLTHPHSYARAFTHSHSHTHPPTHTYPLTHTHSHIPTHTPQVLASYKLWVNGILLGVGPGRGRCSPGVVCKGPYGNSEQPFDGYDITPYVADSEAGGVAVGLEEAEEEAEPLSIFATCFGLDQVGLYSMHHAVLTIHCTHYGLDQSTGKFASGTPKLLLQVKCAQQSVVLYCTMCCTALTSDTAAIAAPIDQRW
jgi:hypothetical protein